MTTRFEVQGHRGARGLFPENTIEGFRSTIALGVRIIELDVAVSADGTPVVFHDVSLNPSIVRDAQGRWIEPPGALLNTLHDRDIAHLDVGRIRPGSAYDAKFSAQTVHDGARIPTLEDVFLLAVAEGVRIDAELKTLPARPDATVSPEAMARAVVGLAEQAAALERLDIRSFDWRGIRAARKLRPELPVTLLTNAESEADPALWWDRPPASTVPQAIAEEWPGATWAPEFSTLTERRVAAAQALGLRVIPWTVNEADDMRRMIAWGCDGVCSDYPDRVLALLE